ncbi:HD-GYP domain-containing protein [soil metagenome]
MSRPIAQETIAVAALRVGMFVHLDVGWMNHPFRLSNFVIESEEQLAQLQTLGLKHVRWSPGLSVDPAQAPEPSEAPAELSSPAPVSSESLRDELVRQRRSQSICDSQFAEATAASARILGRVQAEPAQARQDTERLALALTRKMIDDGPSCLRLLTESAGDQSALHAVNVGVLSLLLGRALDLGEEDLVELGVGALLHDVGKLDLPDAACHADADMAPADAALYRSHVALGVTRGQKMGLSKGAMLVLAMHHERADGAGFPRRLPGAQMTLPARIVALVNRYDGLCNPHWPSSAITPHEAVARLFAREKDAFEPALLASFVRQVGVFPPGSMVQLSDDRFAMVTSVNPQRPLKPRLLIHDPKRPAADGVLTDLEHMPRLNIVRSLPPRAMPRSVREDLVPRQRITYFWEPLAEESAAAC